ncbi:DUF4232 domain-containing protein [Streptomyces varsoviensis]|uniref:DUF4232 domain-containing protein n=1 Tax=Streptomyces varsoviensis TaxID=67373 RepID=UPI0033C313DF
MRTSRIRNITLAAATAALALGGLTACGGADNGSKAAGGDSAGTAQSRSAAFTGGGQAGTDRAAGGSDNAGGSASAGGSDNVGGSGSQKAARSATTAGASQCRGDELLVTAVHRFAGEQGDHLLLTASNKGDKPCWVTSYPSVKLGGDVDSAALPHSKKDAPGGSQRITLQPNGKVYSAVNLFDYGSKHHTAASLALALRDANGHEGPAYSIALKGNKPQFTWNEADVLNWNTKKPYDF